MREAPHPDWLVPDWDAPGVGALMSTRQGGVSAGPFASFNLRDGLGDEPAAVESNRARFARSLGGTPVWLNQVHGTRVVRLGPQDTDPLAPVQSADASITTAPGVACAVQIADCLPVLLAAPNGRGVGAAHAGWRGLADGVIEHTVQALCEATASRPEELKAWLGACIGPERFEVGADVLRSFGVEPGGQGGSPHFRPHAPGKWMADLVGLARERLRVLGVASVSGGRWCTASDASRFFSFRRNRLTGRMAAAVWIESA